MCKANFLVKGITGANVIYRVGFIHGHWYNSWRALFWIEGSVAIAYALIIGIFLPDNPVKAKFINEKEKYIALNRLRVDQIGIKNQTWKWDQFIEALLDVKTWIMVALNVFINVPNGGLGNVSLPIRRARAIESLTRSP